MLSLLGSQNTPFSRTQTSEYQADAVPAKLNPAAPLTPITAWFMNCWFVLQFCNALEANILRSLNAVCNCTVTRVTPGSVNVENTITFPGADGAAAKSAQGDLVTLLKSDDGITSVFGSAYGQVSVRGVEAVDASNPSESPLQCFSVTTIWCLLVATVCESLTCKIVQASEHDHVICCVALRKPCLRLRFLLCCRQWSCHCWHGMDCGSWSSDISTGVDCLVVVVGAAYAELRYATVQLHWALWVGWQRKKLGFRVLT